MAQPVLSGVGDLGDFFYHSDNSLRITDESDFGITYGVTLGLRHMLFDTHTIHVAIGYVRASAKETRKFQIPGGFTYISLAQTSIPIDITYFVTSVSAFDFGIGLSVIATNREMSIDLGASQSPFVDRFNSLAVGPNAIAYFSLPISSDGSLLFISQAKIRYATTVWLDKKGRDLSSYKLNYLHGVLSLGIGWRL